MNVSGILVITRPEWLEETRRRLGALPGVEVHHVHEPTGRLIATVEGETVEVEVERLRRIKGLPHVLLAEMVNHHFEEDDSIVTEIPPDLKDASLTPLPPFLDD